MRRAPRCLRIGAAGLALVTLGALAACGGPLPGGGAPPPTSSAAVTTEASPELLGGPPAGSAARKAPRPDVAATAPVDSMPAPAPAAEPGPTFDFHPMAPVANPEDMPRDQRIAVYGHRYDYLDAKAAPAPVHAVRAASEAGVPVTRTAAAPPRPHPLALSIAAPPTVSAPASHPIAGPPNRIETDWMSIPGTPTVALPLIGRVTSKTVVATGLMLLALVIVALTIAGAPVLDAPRRSARRRTLEIGRASPPPKRSSLGAPLL
jgi:hypothetical protein